MSGGKLNLGNMAKAGVVALTILAGSAAMADVAGDRLCGSGANASICFASVDRAGKVSAAKRSKLAAAAPVAIDLVSSPQFTAELAAFHAGMPADWVAGNRYWRGFDAAQATAATRAAFGGLHIDTIGGLRARFSSTFAGNLAYEGSTDDRTGERNILLNRYRLNRPLGALVNTYVHEAAHKGGYSHGGDQTEDQKCEPPYVMGQLAQKLAEPDKWPSFAASKNACRFWQQVG